MSWFDLLSPFEKAFRNCPGAVVDSPDFDERLPVVTGGLVDRSESIKKEEKGPMVRQVKDIVPYDADLFLDGVQRTLLVKYVKRLPLYFHMSAAVAINSNKDIVEDPLHDFYFLYPKPNLLPSTFPQRLVEATVGTGTSPPTTLPYLIHRAHRVAYRIRRRVEKDILLSLLHRDTSPHKEVLIDGIIPRATPYANSPNLIGVIKSHWRKYLSSSEEAQMFDMSSKFRSIRFSIPFKKGRKRELWQPSFYLRLRHREGDPFFGLVRLEHHRSLDSDRVARTVLQYCLPVADTPAWDRKLYPFYECEMVLQGYLPSLEILKGVFHVH